MAQWIYKKLFGSSVVDEEEKKEFGYHFPQPKKVLGEGGQGWVELAFHNEDGTPVAIKFYYQKNRLDAQNEFRILKQLNHPGVIHVIDFYKNLIRTSTNGIKINTDTMIMDLQPHGELYIQASKGVFGCKVKKDILKTESKVRGFVKLLFSAIEYCHERRVCHLDLKLDNILLDEKWDPVITDFSLCKEMNSENIVQGVTGTPNFYPPEFPPQEDKHKQFRYDGTKVDIFHLGMIIFVLLVGELPFIDRMDEQYRMIFYGAWETLWRNVQEQTHISSEAISFLQSMLEPNPVRRATLLELKQSPWFTIPIRGKPKFEFSGRRKSKKSKKR